MTSSSCQAEGGTWHPADVNNPLPACETPIAAAPPTPVITATTACGQLQQMFDGDMAASRRDAGWADQQKLDLQAATAAANGLAAEHCNGGGVSGGPAPGSAGFGQTFVPVTGAPRTTQRYNQILNNTSAAMNIGLGFLAEEQAQQQADQEAAQAQADAEAEQEREVEAAREEQAQQADAARRAGVSNPWGGSDGPDANPFETASNTNSPNPFDEQYPGGGDSTGIGVAGGAGSPNPTGNPFDPNVHTGGDETGIGEAGMGGNRLGLGGNIPFPASPLSPKSQDDDNAPPGHPSWPQDTTAAPAPTQEVVANANAATPASGVTPDPNAPEVGAPNNKATPAGPSIMGDPHLANSRPTLTTDQCKAKHGEMNGAPYARYCIIGADWYHLEFKE